MWLQLLLGLLPFFYKDLAKAAEGHGLERCHCHWEHCFAANPNVPGVACCVCVVARVGSQAVASADLAIAVAHLSAYLPANSGLVLVPFFFDG